MLCYKIRIRLLCYQFLLFASIVNCKKWIFQIGDPKEPKTSNPMEFNWEKIDKKSFLNMYCFLTSEGMAFEESTLNRVECCLDCSIPESGDSSCLKAEPNYNAGSDKEGDVLIKSNIFKKLTKEQINDLLEQYQNFVCTSLKLIVIFVIFSILEIGSIVYAVNNPGGSVMIPVIFGLGILLFIMEGIHELKFLYFRYFFRMKCPTNVCNKV